MWLRSLYILPLVAVSVTIAATIDPRCLRYSNGMEAQVLPHLQDCRKFVICDMGGYGQVMPCPPGLYFSAEEHTCSFDTVDCRHGELKDGTVEEVQQPPQQPQPVPIVPQPVPEPIPEPLPVPQQPIPSIPFVPPIIVVTSPPSEQNWNPIITQAPPLVEESQEQLNSQHQMDLCRNQPLGVVHPVLDNCALYVVCLGDNRAIVPRCPVGLLFDSKQRRCEFSAFAVCATPRDFVDDSETMVEDSPDALSIVPMVEMNVSTDTERKLPQSMPIVQEPDNAMAEDNGLRVVDNHPRCLARSNPAMTVELPHNTDCTKYLVCVGRVAIEKRCPVGQHWNAVRGWCDFASQAGCKL